MQKSVADADLISQPKTTTKSTIILRVRDSISLLFEVPFRHLHAAFCRLLPEVSVVR
jgi:hypothetical protein